MSNPNLDDLFLAAAELPPSELPAFLDRHCGNDAELRRTLEQLLAADAAARGDEFLDTALFSKPPGAVETPDDREKESDSNRFQILRSHQQGGLGEVLIAFDHQLGREVAIKQIKPKWRDHEEARQRFLQEAEVTGRLEHPGVVPVYAMGSWGDGRQYYAMRFIEGDTLKQKIESYHASGPDTKDTDSRQLQFRQLLGALIDVCNTMNYAHSRRVLHRDLKPSNVMVGPYGETLIVDWGLAKQMDLPEDESMTAAFMRDRSGGTGSTPTQVGGAVGTPQYMSPEQAGGRTDEVGRCTDIYLLGGILYQILTGRPPHSEESLSSLLTKIASGALTPPRSIDAEIPRPLDAICCKAMRAGVSDRYRSAAEMAADLERWMADEPVSVHRDAWTVRASRWGRRHRTLVVAGAVAAVLLTVGSVVGSLVWSAEKSRQLEIRQDRNIKQAQLQSEREQRLSERVAAAKIAQTFADAEIRVDRFSSALGFLQSALDAIGDEPSLESDSQRIAAKSERMRRLVQFYEQADYAHQQNYLSRDTSAMIAAGNALDAVGVWDHIDWWAHLPDDDLTAVQQEYLRKKVYQQLVSFDAILIKSIGTRLSGDRQMRSAASFITMLRRFVRTEAGKDEARAALSIGKRIRNFRPAEAERWYTAMASFRLGEGRRIKASDLGPPRNAADAHNLGVMSLIASLDRSFRFFFGGYLDDDDLQVAHDLFARSSSLRPDHYWSQLSLAHAQALLAQRDGEKSSIPARNRYATAIQTLGRCIALDPNNAFALADRSAVFRMQAEVIEQDDSIDAEQRKQSVTELLRWSLSDVERASQIDSSQHWIHWHYGLSLLSVDQTDQAIERFLRAATEGYPLSRTDDAMLIRFDDLHGREEAAAAVIRRIESSPDDARLQTVLAAIRLNQNRMEEAIDAAEKSLKIVHETSPWAATANIVRGMIHLNQGEYDAARIQFESASSHRPDSGASLDDATSREERFEVSQQRWSTPGGLATWLRYGMTTAMKQSAIRIEVADADNLRRLIDGYAEAERVAVNDHHRAACSLQRAVILAMAGKPDEAKDAIRHARNTEPACDVLPIGRALVDRYRDMKRDNADDSKLAPIEVVIRWISGLPRASRFDFEDQQDDGHMVLALLNDGFELGMAAYWSDPSGASWFNHGGDRSIGEVTKRHARSGRYSLQIAGDPAADPRPAPDVKGPVGAHGRTGQNFPARAGYRYRVSVWARAENLSDAALSITAGRKEPAIKIPGGTYGWTRLEGQLELPVTAEQKRGNVVNCRLEIVSTGPGTAWIDDFRVESLHEEESEE